MPHQPATCACMNIRKAARLIAQFYDQRLQPSGLRNTQFSLLVTLKTLAPVPVTRLAEHMGMDRTTLTRNLKRLEKDGFIRSRPDEDARVRMLVLTNAGAETIEQARPYWEAAQSAFLEKFGQDRWAALRGELTDVNGAVTPA